MGRIGWLCLYMCMYSRAQTPYKAAVSARSSHLPLRWQTDTQWQSTSGREKKSSAAPRRDCLRTFAIVVEGEEGRGDQSLARTRLS